MDNRYRGTYDEGYGTGLGRFRGGWRKGDWRKEAGLGLGGDWRRRRSCSYYVGGRRVEVPSGEDVTVKGERKTCLNGRLTDDVGLSRTLGYQPRYGGIGDGYRGYNTNRGLGFNNILRGYNTNRGHGFNKILGKDINGYNRYDDFGGIFNDFDYGRQQACGGIERKDGTVSDIFSGCRWKGRVYCSGDVIEVSTDSGQDVSEAILLQDLPSWKFETRCIEGKAKVVARQWGEVAENLRIPIDLERQLL